MKNNEMSIESIYDKGLGSVNQTSNIKSTEFLFDGDFDALSADIQSLENTVDFANAYQSVESCNSAQKIRMCKKLQLLTRGHTKYHESVENYLDNVMSREADAAVAPAEGNTDNKPATQDTNKPQNPDDIKKKEAWYTKMWNFIKNIFTQLMEWIKARIAQFSNWIHSKFGGNKDAELEQIKKDNPETFKSIVDGLGKLSFETQSKDGFIPLNNNCGQHLAESFGAYRVLCQKFSAIVNEIVSTTQFTTSMSEHLNQVLDAITKMVGTSVPKLNSTSPEDIKNFNTQTKQSNGNLKYDHDPAKYVEVFTGNKIVTEGSFDVKSAVGSPDPQNLITVCNEVSSNLSTASKEIGDLLKSIEDANNKFLAYMKKSGFSNGNNELNADHKSTDQTKANDDLIFEVMASVTNLFNTITKVGGILQTIIGKVCKESNDLIKGYFDVKRSAIENKENSTVGGKLGLKKDKEGRAEYENERNQLDKGLKGKAGNVKNNTFTGGVGKAIGEASKAPGVAAKSAGKGIGSAVQNFQKGFKQGRR